MIKINDYKQNKVFTFTNKLKELVKDHSLFDINIDGPYGESYNYAQHDKCVFLAGGVGITPIMNSILELV